MTDYKSLDYLTQIKKDNILTDNELTEILQNIAYILADNEHENARYFLEELIEIIEDNKL